MPKIELQHNDDEVLDPLDATLRTRGSLRVDGHERGSWDVNRNNFVNPKTMPAVTDRDCMKSD